MLTGLVWMGAYGAVGDGARSHLAGLVIDTYGTRAVDCVVCDDGLGENVWRVGC